MATFSRKAYYLIAGALKTGYRETEDCMDSSVVIADIMRRLADLFERDNREFSRQRFYDAIGITIPTEEVTQHGENTS